MSHTNISSEKDLAMLGHSRESDTNGNVLKQSRGEEEKGDADRSLSRPGTGDTTSTDLSEAIQAIPEGPTDNVPATRIQSHSSLYDPNAIVVPRYERRGLLAKWTLIAEVQSAYTYKRLTKWFITFLVALAAAAAPIGSAILLPALPDITKDFNSSATIANLSVALYMLSMSIFPLWWSSFSETNGRRSVYLISFALFTIWNVVAAKSTSMSMLIVLRMLGGGAAASVQAVGSGTIADIWETKERGHAMSIFYLGPLLGPLLAPIIGGVLTETLGWRSTQWFQVIYGGLLCILLTFCLPETISRKNTHPTSQFPLNDNTTNDKGVLPGLTQVSTRQSIKQKSKATTKTLKRWFIEPLSVLLYLRFPAVLLTVYLASVTFGSLYILNISIQQTFSSPPYSFKVIILGLLYIPNSVGYVVASIFGGKWNDYIMHRVARKAGRYDENGHLVFHPEDRMQENAWIAAAVFPAALIWYGWTAEKGVLWVAPCFANFFFGLGSMIIFGVATTMLTEFMPKRASSGVAVNNFVRNIFSCIGGVITQPIISAIGDGWLFTIVGIVCWVSAGFVVLAMRRYAPKWRIAMDAALAAKT
ncbi:related to MFS multidrug resistance transporter [Phialocephala subalpina]|uniref:Related to MFS multidrug resistance transporter n=1 Tax=Phialocephala subalpina TaxID=576137 RepID=A0A1L7X426_9HELO|nr:related to MFS multidrug resistance transporter [Phialocephala subalpina]